MADERYYDRVVRRVARIKRYGTVFKLVYFKAGLPDGCVRAERDSVEEFDGAAYNKIAASISRTKATVLELALCNDWQYFITLTLDKAKYDRYALPAWQRDLSQWLRNYRRLKGCKVAYLLVPEQHKDGAWHMHGLIAGLPAEYLSAFIPGLHPQDLVDKGYLNWAAYEGKFGFCSLAPIKSHEAVSRYMVKYIRKDLARRSAEFGCHLYYASQGLQRAELVEEGYLMPGAVVNPDFDGDWVTVKWYDSRVDCPPLY